MSDIVIKVSNLAKSYTIAHQGAAPRMRYQRFSDVVLAAAKFPLRKLRRTLMAATARGAPVDAYRTNREDFWALKDVSFDVHRGDVIGIVGRNGAGKSTLLKILSRITEPSRGRVEIDGRVASLLEVGTGFHPELTGRENIYLNGAILGMNRAEIRSKFDEIVAFAEVEKFLDTPVKRYSSGMYVRLAFAVAAHLEPEILVVDEVLAVGDMQFQKKCLGKMEDVASKQGRTILFVSHNMAAVNRLCQKAILLSHGSIATAGNTAEVVSEYLKAGSGEVTEFIPDSNRKFGGSDIVTLVSASIRDPDGNVGPNFGSGVSLTVNILYRIHKPTRGLRVGFHLHGPDGTIVFNTTDCDSQLAQRQERMQAGLYSSQCVIPGGLLNRGQYSLTIGSDVPMMVNFYYENAIAFFMIPDGRADGQEANRPGLVCPSLSWEVCKVPDSEKLGFNP